MDYILGQVKSGAIQPGDRLQTEKQLTESLGVSRTCVREALKSLESLRTISIKPRVGAVLLEPTSGALFNAEYLSAAARQQHTDVLIEIRKILEIGLVPLAAERATAEDLQAMKKAIDEHDVALATGAFAYPADIAFHLAIAKSTKNPIAVTILQMIAEPLSRQRKLTEQIPNASQSALRDHLNIYRAIENHQPEQARLAMVRHMNSAERHWRIAEARTSEPTSAAQTQNNIPHRGSRDRHQKILA